MGFLGSGVDVDRSVPFPLKPNLPGPPAPTFEASKNGGTLSVIVSSAQSLPWALGALRRIIETKTVTGAEEAQHGAEEHFWLFWGHQFEGCLGGFREGLSGPFVAPTQRAVRVH